MAKVKLKEYKRLTEPVFTMPGSIQDVIPINRISQKGIFELEAGEGIKLYDRMYLFEDANYATQDEEEKELMQNQFKKFLNSMNVDFKIIISNEPESLQELNNGIMNRAIKEENEPLALAYQEYFKDKGSDVRKGIEQKRYFIISCLKFDYESAVSFFKTVESNIATWFKRMGSTLIPLNAAQRLRALHIIFRIGNERRFKFSWEESLRLKRDWRRDVLNTTIKEYDEYLSFDYGKKFASVLFISSYPSGLEDTFVKEITKLPFQLIYTEDLEPVDKDYANDMLMKKYMGVQRSIDNQQERKNKNGNFSTDVSYDRRREVEELEDALDGLRSFDEKMFYSDILICVCGDSKKELEENIEQVKMTAKSYTVELSTHKYRQLDAFKTILPTAARFVDTMRPLFTTAVSGFVPFNVQEFYDPSGFFYGVNQISGKEIRINRKKLKNGNGFAFGISGSGKSQDVKLEIGQVIVYTDDDVLIADPMGEYRESVDEWNGHYITFGMGENAEYINPLHILEGIKNEKDFITGKAEFMYALCEQAIKPDALTNKHINIIDRAVKDVYEEFFELRLKGETTDSPVITDIRNRFIQYHKETGNKYAEDLAEELEMFVTGTLNVFTHQQTLKRDNRVMGYSLDSLGKKMKSIAMLVIIEEIRTRIKYNKGNKKATWVYFDEIHEFWDDDYAVAELDATWREIRKNGGLATGMTQMILDGLKNPNTKAMISNTEFTMLLEQGNVDKENLFDVFDISNEQLSYVCGVVPGTGIIRAGKKIIPFDNVVPKNNKLYELYNTSFHDEDIEDE